MVPITEILIVPHAHHDVGYTHVPEVSLRLHEQTIGTALDLCARAADDESPAAFRWTLEISRPLLAFLRHAPPAEIARLQTLVAQDRLAITAGYLHMTQLIGHEEYVRFFAPLRRLRQEVGLPVSILQHGDINGLSWGVVPVMRGAGLDCLVLALNPDHGRLPFEQPSAFFWEGPDGGRVLVWLSPHYSLAHNPWELSAGRIERAVAPLTALARRAEERADYPFDFLLLHSAEDNMLPNGAICAAVRAWNAQGLTPPLRIATMAQAMARARTQARSTTLPVVRGEWADWWAHGHGSSAYEVGISRLARAELRAAEVGRALGRLTGPDVTGPTVPGVLPVLNWYRSGNTIPPWADWAERVAAAYDDLLLFEEHTWGTFESITQPFSLFTQSHWNQKAGFAFRAVSAAHDLAREALAALVGTLPPGADPALVVLNPLSVPRAERVPVRVPGADRLVWVPEIAPLSVTVVPWSPETPEPVTEETLPPGTPATVENAFYRLTVDPATGAITRLADRASGREWVDPAALGGIGAVVYETVAPGEDHPAIRLGRQHFHPDTPGPRFTRAVARGTGGVRVERAAYGTTLTVETAAPYLPRIETVFTLYDSVDRIDLTLTLDKQENYAMEGVYVLFPFTLAAPTFWLETANAVYRAEHDQLPHSCRDWYSLQHGLGVTDGQASVLWATREAPLVQLGDFHTGEWATALRAPRGHVYAWLMNNLYFTNFKAAQGGRATFHFRLATRAGAVDGAAVRAWGETFAAPPLARPAPVAPGTYQWLQIAPATVLVQVLTPSMAMPPSVVLRLKETAGQAGRATITWLGPGAVDLVQTDLLESEPGRPLAGDGRVYSVDLAAHQLATLRLVPR